MFNLNLETENDAFKRRPLAEIARILRETADRVANGTDEGKIRDLNGNTVGTFTYTEEF